MRVALLLACCAFLAAACGGGGDNSAAAPHDSTTTSATTSAQRTTSTTAPTTTVSKPPVPPQIFSGKGDSVVKASDPGPGVVIFECAKCTGNTVLKSNGAEGLLVNTIGAYTGKRWINIEGNSRTTQFTINAKGSWKLTVGGYDLATLVKTSEAKGNGDDVIAMLTNATLGIVTHEGEGNFVVQVLSASTAGGGGVDLAVNQIGSYTGTVPMLLPGLVQVTAKGSWLIVAGT